MALEEDPGISARIHSAVALAGCDHPDPLERLLASLGQRHAVRLLPLPAGVAVGVEDLRAVERRGDGGQQPPAARIARREVDRLSRECTGADLEPAARLALEQEQSLLRPDQQLSHSSPSCYRRYHLDTIRRPDRGGLSRLLAAHDPVDVAAGQPALVEDPTAELGVVLLERPEQLDDGRAFELVLGAICGELAQRPSQANDGHARILCRVMIPETPPGGI